MSSWDEYQPELERLAAEGFSASLIAGKLGITRNAVIGRCNRTGVKLLGLKNIQLMHCKRGHPFDTSNTYVYFWKGVFKQRKCRECELDRARRRRQKAA